MSTEHLKEAAARAALGEVRPGMLLGLGTGSTAAHFVRLLGEQVRDGLDVTGVPTSEVTAAQARAEGIRLTTLEEAPSLDLTIDGADEFDAALTLIKGGGGALLREKIVAAASRRMLVIADGAKEVGRLGAFPLPIEVNRFGLEATRRAILSVFEGLGYGTAPLALRTAKDGAPFVTDGGHLILDAPLGAIDDAAALGAALHRVPGVVEHGLFIGLCAAAYVARPSGVAVVTPTA
jgi:ribose 5-phosphate isomerase A